MFDGPLDGATRTGPDGDIAYGSNVPGGADENSCRGGSLRFVLPAAEPCASNGDGLRDGLIDCGGEITATPAAPELRVDCAPATDGNVAARVSAVHMTGARHRRRSRIASAGVVWIARNTRDGKPNATAAGVKKNTCRQRNRAYE